MTHYIEIVGAILFTAMAIFLIFVVIAALFVIIDGFKKK